MHAIKARHPHAISTLFARLLSKYSSKVAPMQNKKKYDTLMPGKIHVHANGSALLTATKCIVSHTNTRTKNQLSFVRCSFSNAGAKKGAAKISGMSTNINQNSELKNADAKFTT